MAIHGNIKDQPQRASDRITDSIALSSTVAAAQYEPTSFKATMQAENTRIATDKSIQQHLAPVRWDNAGTAGGVDATTTKDVRAGSSPVAQDQYVAVREGFSPGVDSYEKSGSTSSEDKSITTSERRLAPPSNVNYADAGQAENPHLRLRVDMQF